MAGLFLIAFPGIFLTVPIRPATPHQTLAEPGYPCPVVLMLGYSCHRCLCFNLNKVDSGDNRPRVLTQKCRVSRPWLHPPETFSTGTLTSDPYDFANSWALSSGEQRCQRASPPSSVCNVSSELQKVGPPRLDVGCGVRGFWSQEAERYAVPGPPSRGGASPSGCSVSHGPLSS